MKIPYGKQNITNTDIESVVETLRSDFLTQGPRIAQFEKAFAEYIGCKYAVAVSSGTAALHLNALALGVKPGTKVITTPITFAATANCIRYCGGEVEFADIDPETYLIDISSVKKLLEQSPKGTYSGIIPVDFAGRPVDMEVFRQLADNHGLWLIEDACHAPGASFIDTQGREQRCGNGHYADLAIFSFHPVKHIAAGMITTNDHELFEKLCTLRTHGITKDVASYQNSPGIATGISGNEEKEYPGWYMEMQELGYNYRITDIQAALGNSQLKRANEGIRARRSIACRYYEAFADIPQITDRNKEAGQFADAGTLQEDDGGAFYHESPDPLSDKFGTHTPREKKAMDASRQKSLHAYHLYIIEVEDRLGLYNALREHNIFTQIHYIPLHLMPYYTARGHKKGDYPNAEKYYQGCISLPMYPTLSRKEQEFVIKTIKDFFN
jgi:dTDP-4-amino-4,6-dideoxygalactose transaminase